MHIAIGYRWFATALGAHIERALADAGCATTFVGLGGDERSGRDASTPLPAIMAASQLDQTYAYLWIDPAGRYFPPGIEDLNALTAGYIVDAHLGHWRESAARFFDVVFLAQKRYIDHYKRLLGHEQVYWLPLGADARAHRDHD